MSRTQRMTPKERLWAAVRGEPLDTFPVAPRIWRYAMSVGKSHVELAKEYDFEASLCGGNFPTAMSVDLDDCAKLCPELQMEVRTERQEQKTRIERTFHTPAGTLHDVLVQPDAGEVYGLGPNAEWLEPLVKTPEDAERLPYLLPLPERLRERFDETRRLEQEVGDLGFVAIRPSHGPDHITLDALGPERALTASLIEPDFFNRVIEIADTWHTEILRLMLEDGFRLIFNPLYNFSLSVGWSPAFYRETVAPLLKRHADLVHSYDGTLFFYDDGKMAKSVGYMIEAGADIIETLTPAPAGDVVYPELAAQYGGKACLKGGIDTVRIRFGTPEEIERTVREAVETLAPTRRFILSASDSITEGTPEENLRAFFDAGRKYGRELARRIYA